jgi:hypothetical protein
MVLLVLALSLARLEERARSLQAELVLTARRLYYLQLFAEQELAAQQARCQP